MISFEAYDWLLCLAFLITVFYYTLPLYLIVSFVASAEHSEVRDVTEKRLSTDELAITEIENLTVLNTPDCLNNEQDMAAQRATRILVIKKNTCKRVRLELQ